MQNKENNSPAALRAAFEERQSRIQNEPGVRAVRVGNENVYDDGMLDQCGIGYYPPVEEKKI
jgi:hypothetical protein